MKLINLLVVLVLLHVAVFVRDLLVLPLFNQRILIVDSSVVILALSMMLSLQTRERLEGQDCIQGRCVNFGVSRRPFNLIIVYDLVKASLSWTSELLARLPLLLDAVRMHFITIIFFALSVLLYISSKANESTLLFYFWQFFLLAIVSLYFGMIGSVRSLHSLSIIALRVLIIMAVVLALLVVAYISSLHDTKDLFSRNSLPVISIVLRLIFQRLGDHKSARIALTVGVVLAILASTKIFILLLFLLYLSGPLVVRTGRLVGAIKYSCFFLIVLAPFLLPQFVMYQMDVTLDYIVELGENRYYINDGVASLISRLFSVYSLVHHESFLASFFGAGEASIPDLHFWGYPVHNLPLSLIYSHGYTGLLASCSIVMILSRLIKYDFRLSLVGAFSLTYFNDLYPFFALIFVPLIRPNFFGVSGNFLGKRQAPRCQCPHLDKVGLRSVETSELS